MGKRTDSIDLADGQVFGGTDEGFGHGCSGAAATCQEFLSGKLNDLVGSTFGAEVLGEVPTNSFKPEPLRGSA